MIYALRNGRCPTSSLRNQRTWTILIEQKPRDVPKALQDKTHQSCSPEDGYSETQGFNLPNQSASSPSGPRHCSSSPLSPDTSLPELSLPARMSPSSLLLLPRPLHEQLSEVYPRHASSGGNPPRTLAPGRRRPGERQTDMDRRDTAANKRQSRRLVDAPGVSGQCNCQQESPITNTNPCLYV